MVWTKISSRLRRPTGGVWRRCNRNVHIRGSCCADLVISPGQAVVRREVSGCHRGVGVWYLNCPRCGLTITPKVPLQAVTPCPRCLARTRTSVDLFSSAIPIAPPELRVVARTRADSPSGASTGTVPASGDAPPSRARTALRLALSPPLVLTRPTSTAPLTVGTMRPPSPRMAASREPARPDRPQPAGRPRRHSMAEVEPPPAA